VEEYRIRNRERLLPFTRSSASNLEQVSNLLCDQANLASYSQRDGKWVAATVTGWTPSVADRGDGVPAVSGSNCNKWPHNALRRYRLMPISCHFRDCKALLVTGLKLLPSPLPLAVIAWYDACGK